MKTTYGLPYMGSKSEIAMWVIDNLPSAGTLVDLFAGGCSITHAALLSGKWKRVIANDITDAPQLFIDAANGKYRDEKRWIPREEFYALKDSDPYIRTCWSFGINQKTYLYSKELEPYKKALHYAMVLGDFTLMESFGIRPPHVPRERLKAWIKLNHDKVKDAYVKWYCKEILRIDEKQAQICVAESKVKRSKEELRNYLREALAKSGIKASDVDMHLGRKMSQHYFDSYQWQFPTREAYEKMKEILPLEKPWEICGGYLQTLQTLQNLQRVECLQSLERINNLQNLKKLNDLQSLKISQGQLYVSQKDYRDVEIPGDAVVYCDIPYKGTGGYTCDFDHAAFYEWAQRQSNPIFISEYNMPEPFVCIAAKSKICKMSRTNNLKTIERIFTMPQWVDTNKSGLGL